jgi:hypothetical protein
MEKEVQPRIARAAGRISGRILRRNKIVKAGIEVGMVTARAAHSAARRLWLEVTGFLFGVFAVIGGAATVRQYVGGADTPRIALGAMFTLAFAYFSITSFLASRRSRPDV